ncbi:MAG: helix-turn-helix domain-containing protein [Dietzia cercidiphylli]
MGRSEQTRERLLRAALELMGDRGYDGVTTAAVAGRAGVSEMTLFRHFPTKAALLVDDPYDPLIADAIARRPADEPPLTAVVRGIRDSWNSVPEPAAEAVRERLRIVAETPSLAGALAAGSRATEDAIVSALAGRAVTPPAARIAAAAVVAALNASLLEWAVGTDPSLDSALEHVFRVLEGRDD